MKTVIKLFLVFLIDHLNVPKVGLLADAQQLLDLFNILSEYYPVYSISTTIHHPAKLK